MSVRRATAATAFALVVATAGVGARAASNAGPAPAATPVPFSVPPGDEEIRGRIAAIPGKFQLRVRDERGFMDDVSLHQGTVILPAGLTLKPGMQVRIAGVASGKTFAADIVATPYTAAPPRGGLSAEDCAGSGNAAIPQNGPPAQLPILPPGSC